VIDLAEQFLDRPAAGLGLQQPQRLQPVQRPVGFAQPAPRLYGIAEHPLGVSSGPRQPQRPVGLLDGQQLRLGLAARKYGKNPALLAQNR
jgi:hypothetical protein